MRLCVFLCNTHLPYWTVSLQGRNYICVSAPPNDPHGNATVTVSTFSSSKGPNGLPSTLAPANQLCLLEGIKLFPITNQFPTKAVEVTINLNNFPKGLSSLSLSCILAPLSPGLQAKGESRGWGLFPCLAKSSIRSMPGCAEKIQPSSIPHLGAHCLAVKKDVGTVSAQGPNQTRILPGPPAITQGSLCPQACLAGAP